MNTWVVTKFRYQQIASQIEPAAKLTTKDHWIWPIIWWVMYSFVFIFTLGFCCKLFKRNMSLEIFLKEYATTFGPLHAYPRQFDKLSKRLLVHECRHTTHCVWLGWLIPIVGWFCGRRVRAYCGLPLYALFYLLIFFPIGLAYFRYRIELDCDVAAYKWALNNGYDPNSVRERSIQFAEKVSGWSYGKAWFRKCVLRGFQNAAERIIANILVE